MGQRGEPVKPQQRAMRSARGPRALDGWLRMPNSFFNRFIYYYPLTPLSYLNTRGEIPMLETCFFFSSKPPCLPTAGENSGIENFGIEESRFTGACFEKEYMVPHVSDIKI